jgi:hypothetical protein
VKQAIPTILKQYKNQSIINKEKYYPKEKAKPKKDWIAKTSEHTEDKVAKEPSYS